MPASQSTATAVATLLAEAEQTLATAPVIDVAGHPSGPDLPGPAGASGARPTSATVPEDGRTPAAATAAAAAAAGDPPAPDGPPSIRAADPIPPEVPPADPADSMTAGAESTVALVESVSQAPPPVSPSSATQPPAATPPRPPPPPVIDQGVLEELRAMLGDELDRLIEVFLEDTPRLLARLEIAAAGPDYDALRDAAHSLKSSSANLGAMLLSAAARRIEQGAREGNLARPAVAVALVTNEFARARRQLRSGSHTTAA